MAVSNRRRRQFNGRQNRRRCQADGRANCAEMMRAESAVAIVVGRRIGLRLRLQRHGGRWTLDAFEMDMAKGQNKLDRQREERCPGTKTSVAPDPIHFRISQFTKDIIRGVKSKSVVARRYLSLQIMISAAVRVTDKAATATRRPYMSFSVWRTSLSTCQLVATLPSQSMVFYDS